jgi:hypothetical protein
MKATRFLVAAGVSLAMALTFSCSDNDDGDKDPFSDIPGYEYWKESLKYYDPDDKTQRCRNGVVEMRCEVDGKEVWYSPLTHVCGSSGSDACVEGEVCEPTRTYFFGTIERCGNELYGSYNNVRCESCGSKSYIVHSYKRCQSGVVEERCDSGWYNVETHYCDWNTGTIKAIERCGSGYISSDSRCNNGVIEGRCGYGENPIWYNRITQSCENGIVKNKVKC